MAGSLCWPHAQSCGLLGGVLGAHTTTASCPHALPWQALHSRSGPCVQHGQSAQPLSQTGTGRPQCA
eukprot:1666256-Alexandrium_andersonii.AAC.1